MLRPISWKNNTFPQLGESPQKILNKQIVEKADICVAIFWIKFGTKTEKYNSGTEEEIENMLENNKRVFLYFFDKPIRPSDIDKKQYNRLNRFKDKFKNNKKSEGYYFSVLDEHDLSNKFKDHLELYMNSIVHGEQFNQLRVSKLILWVDDYPENNVYVRNILENYGLKFDLALSTESALRLIKTNDYSLILSDMGRKEGSREGYVLLHKIRSDNNNIPFIIYSYEGSLQEHKEEAKKNGAQYSTDNVLEVVDITLKLLLNS